MTSLQLGFGQHARALRAREIVFPQSTLWERVRELSGVAVLTVPRACFHHKP